jgi:hypothetical protein
MNLTKQQQFIRLTKRPQMPWCLEVLGVEMLKTTQQRDAFKKQNRLNSTVFSKLPERILWDIYERARINFRKLSKVLHPDKGGNEDKFKQLTFCWRFVRNYFLKLGIA